MLFATLLLAAASTTHSWDAHMLAGNTAFREGRYADAEREYRAALQLRTVPSPELAASLNNLASSFHELGRFNEAERLYLRSVEMWGDGTGAAQPLNNLGTLYRQQRRFTDAVKAYERSLGIRLAEHGPAHPSVARVLHNLGRVHQMQNRLDVAEQMYRRALHLFEQAHESAAEVAGVLGNVAAVEAQTGRRAAARQTFAEAIRLAESDRTGHPVLVDIFLKAALAEQEAKNHPEAERHFERARALAEHLLGPRHPITATIDTHRAATLRKLKRKEEATRLESEAAALLRTFEGAYTVDLAELKAASLR